MSQTTRHAVQISNGRRKCRWRTEFQHLEDENNVRRRGAGMLVVKNVSFRAL
jgi:hypothetical protein